MFRDQNRSRTVLYSNPCLEANYSPGRKMSLGGSQRCPLEKDYKRALSNEIEAVWLHQTFACFLRKYHREWKWQ